MPEVSKLLRELVALPSVNPAFLSDAVFTGEARVAEFIAGLSRQAGLGVAWQKVLSGRRNLLVTLEARGKRKRRVLLAPHLDTVGGREFPGRLFRPRVSSGKLFGRGACDTKGSVAVMVRAMLEMAKNRERPAETEIVFAGLVDEENAQLGSRVLAKSKLKADLAIVGEPTRCKLVTAHKGDLWLKLVTHGKAAHGARPELGRNAVHEMARVVDLLEGPYAAGLKKRSHPLLGNPTINVGAIRGGLQPNIVPDECEILVDRRTLPGENDSQVQQEILGAARREGLNADLLNYKNGACPALETDPDLPLVREFMGLARQKEPVGVDFFCDAAILAKGGTPSVVFGPGDIAQAHTEDEWIAIAELEKAERLLLSFLRSLP